MSVFLAYDGSMGADRVSRYAIRLAWRHLGEELAVEEPLYRSATGITLATVVLMQIANVVGRRSLMGSGLDAGLLRNSVILLGVAFEIAFSWAILYLPPVQEVLGTGPVEWYIYALAFTGIPLLFISDLLRKMAVRICQGWRCSRDTSCVHD